jgi:hypothetical protein
MLIIFVFLLPFLLACSGFTGLLNFLFHNVCHVFAGKFLRFPFITSRAFRCSRIQLSIAELSISWPFLFVDGSVADPGWEKSRSGIQDGKNPDPG